MNRALCEHPNFEVFARVNRIGRGDEENPSPPWRYSADVHVRCSDCKVRFRWLGMEEQMGMSYSKPMVSPDHLELRAPLEPDAHVTMLMAGDSDLGWPAA